MHAPLATAALPFQCSLRDRLPISWRARTIRADHRFVSRLDRIISVSAVHAASLARHLGLSANAINVVPNGVSVERFIPRTSSNGSTEIVIGAAGRLVSVKRFDRLMNIFAKLVPNRKLRLRIAGDGPDHQRLQEQASNQGLAEQIELLGSVEDMPGFLQSLDVFALSSDSEALPYVQLEAMAAGLPSVVTDVGDLRRVVRDGIDGYVVPVDDPKAFVDRLALLVDAPDRRRQMGDSARERVCAEFSQAASSKATLRVFREVAHRS